jgi:hypothetical protein
MNETLNNGTMNDVQRVKQRCDPDLFVRLVQEKQQAQGEAPQAKERAEAEIRRNRAKAKRRSQWEKQQRTLLALEAVVFTALVTLLWAVFALIG